MLQSVIVGRLSVRHLNCWASLVGIASFPGLAHLSQYKFTQKACCILSRDAYRSLYYNHSTGISDVKHEQAPCSALKEAPRDHSDGSYAKLPKSWQ